MHAVAIFIDPVGVFEISLMRLVFMLRIRLGTVPLDGPAI
jgi:hypothetical protein